MRLQVGSVAVLSAWLVLGCGSKAPEVEGPGGGGAEGGEAGAGEGGGKAGKPIAPLLEGLGSFQRTVSTKDPMAQKYFSQGLMLSYAFNHREAERSFREAARRDPSCAMCWWGIALVRGPNINAKMEPEDLPVCLEAMDKARATAAGTSELEQGLIAALDKRYVASPPEDRAPLDEAYAAAMRQLAEQYPEDPDVLALTAEALMDLHPWDYWQKNRKAQPWTAEILALLEKTMALAPEHPGANHLYIHAVEAGPTPEMGLPAAERLGGLAPGAGHLVHMPAHIYIRTGRFHEGTEANQRAIASDDAYLTQCRQQGIYPLAYAPHNHHFLWATASFEGRSKLAIEAANVLRKRVPREKMSCHGLGTLQHYHVTPLYAFVRFGKWAEVMAEPQPEGDLAYPLAVWRYARAMALIFQDDLAGADKELAELRTLAANPQLETVTVWDINTTKALMEVAVKVVEGEMAARKKDFKSAIRHLEEAIKLEDALNYDEPPDWYYPVRHALGAVYLEAKRPKDAERVYRQDLEVWRENGFALFGLREALKAQKKAAAAGEVDQRFQAAWKHADHTLTSSRF
jgi:tetratricopeptide (TPR) repeat protein